MDRQFEVLLHEIGHEERNVKGIAAAIKDKTGKELKSGTCNAWLNINRDDMHFPAKWLPTLIETTGNDEPIHFLCRTRGYVAFRCDPSPTVENQAEWLKKSARLAKESAESVSAIIEAVADGTITKKEREKCMKEAYEAAQAAYTIFDALRNCD